MYSIGMEMTPAQKRVLKYIEGHILKRGYPPTVREVAGHFGYRSPLAAQLHIDALVKKGYVKKSPSRSRSLEVVGLRPYDARRIPVAGRIRAGEPVLAIEDIDSHILVDRNFFSAEDAFSLRVTGDSMVDAGIFEGDFVIVKPQGTIENGEIGVVLIEDEATVKRIFKKKNTVTLKPENRTMEPVSYPASRITIIGRVLGVIRKL